MIIMRSFQKTVDDVGDKLGKQLKEMDQMLGAFCERLQTYSREQDNRRDAFRERMQTRLREQDNRRDELFNGIEKSLRDNAAEHHNARAIFMNGIIDRLHHEIVPIQVLRSRQDGESEWRSSPMVPKTFGDVYRLGQRAKGIFVSNRDLNLLATNKEYSKSSPSSSESTLRY